MQLNVLKYVVHLLYANFFPLLSTYARVQIEKEKHRRNPNNKKNKNKKRTICGWQLILMV